MHSIILTLLFYCPVTVAKALQNFGHTVEAFVSDHLENTKNTKKCYVTSNVFRSKQLQDIYQRTISAVCSFI